MLENEKTKQQLMQRNRCNTGNESASKCVYIINILREIEEDIDLWKSTDYHKRTITEKKEAFWIEIW